MKFTGFCGFVTIVSFGLTIWVTITTTKTNKRVQELKNGKRFNCSKDSTKKTLKAYQELLRSNNDNININILKDNILNDINASYENYKYILRFYQKRTYKKLIKELNKPKNLDKNLICNLISKIYGYFDTQKEEI